MQKKKRYKAGDTYEGEKLGKGVKIKVKETKNTKKVVKKYKTDTKKRKQVEKFKGRDSIFDASPNKRVSLKNVKKDVGTKRKVRKTK